MPLSSAGWWMPLELLLRVLQLLVKQVLKEDCKLIPRNIVVAVQIQVLEHMVHLIGIRRVIYSHLAAYCSDEDIQFLELQGAVAIHINVAKHCVYNLIERFGILKNS